MRIGLFGGTFDPPHLGHLAVAEAAQAQLSLDTVLWIPSARNPLKRGHPSAPRHRLEMTRLMVEHRPNMAVSDIEVTRGGPSYSIETLEELQMVMQGKFWLLLGADSLATFHEWRQSEKIVEHARLAVAARPGQKLDAIVHELNPLFAEALDVVEVNPHPASASQIREDIQRGLSPERWLDPAVWHYIKESGLYSER